jgi:hypothetical protein
VPLSSALREYAETPARFSYVPAGISVERFADDRVCVIQGATWAEVSGVNVAVEELDELIAEMRRMAAADKEPMWVVGPSSRPTNLFEELQARGFQSPRDGVATSRALGLIDVPEAPSAVATQQVETFEQYVAAQQIAWDAFDWTEERRAKNRVRLAADYEEMIRRNQPVHFIAHLDGRPAGAGALVTSDRGVLLVGGSVASWARGRGIYRALVRARWDFAVERGTPALVTHANPKTSYPILRRLGFEEVCELRRLEDQSLRVTQTT